LAHPAPCAAIRAGSGWSAVPLSKVTVTSVNRPSATVTSCGAAARRPPGPVRGISSYDPGGLRRGSGVLPVGDGTQLPPLAVPDERRGRELIGTWVDLPHHHTGPVRTRPVMPLMTIASHVMRSVRAAAVHTARRVGAVPSKPGYARARAGAFPKRSRFPRHWTDQTALRLPRPYAGATGIACLLKVLS